MRITLGPSLAGLFFSPLDSSPCPPFNGYPMPVLTDAELRMVAEIVAELAKYRGRSFDKAAKGHVLARAALIDPAFKARLAEIHRRLEVRRKTDISVKLLAPLTPLFRDLERDAEAVLSGWRKPE